MHSSGPADAASTFTVNKTGNAKDINIANSVCDSSSNRGIQCTLRAAIQESNNTPGADTINFNIGGTASVKTIKPASPLPTLKEAVTINGYSQSGASENGLAEGNDAVLKIVLNGVDAGSANGLVIQAPGSTVRGLVINRFAGNGVLLSGSGATGNKVEGNFIGTNAAGNSPLGNDDGVVISSGSDSTIGGTASGAGNRIAHNDQDGVLVFSGAAVGNSILSNSIFSNGELGIDLAGGTEDSFGVTANDDDDPDAPSSNNHRQNYPVIISAIRSNTTNFTTISGTLNSNPSQTYTIQCFVAVPDPSGHGEGQIPAGQDTTVTTNASGDDNSFTCVSPIPQAGQAVTATATNTRGTAPGTQIGDTSEFSQNVGVTPVP